MGWEFCPPCAAEVARCIPPGCIRCGRPLDRDVPRCVDCPPGPLAWARAAFVYEGPVRRALIRLKFAGLRSLADAFGPAMAAALEAWDRETTVQDGRDGGPHPPLTWVPLGRDRRRRRGFDQARMLADAVGRHSGRSVMSLLERTRETLPQARRAGAERRQALADAFRGVRRPPSRVVLIDDVLTSGATAAACASALVDAGAEEVGVLTAARSLGGAIPARCYTAHGLPPGSVVAR